MPAIFEVTAKRFSTGGRPAYQRIDFNNFSTGIAAFPLIDGGAKSRRRNRSTPTLRPLPPIPTSDVVQCTIAMPNVFSRLPTERATECKNFEALYAPVFDDDDDDDNNNYQWVSDDVTVRHIYESVDKQPASKSRGGSGQQADDKPPPISPKMPDRKVPHKRSQSGPEIGCLSGKQKQLTCRQDAKSHPAADRPPAPLPRTPRHWHSATLECVTSEFDCQEDKTRPSPAIFPKLVCIRSIPIYDNASRRSLSVPTWKLKPASALTTAAAYASSRKRCDLVKDRLGVRHLSSSDKCCVHDHRIERSSSDSPLVISDARRSLHSAPESSAASTCPSPSSSPGSTSFWPSPKSVKPFQELSATSTDAKMLDAAAKIRAFTVDDVAESLSSLKLTKFVDKFRQHDIDGWFLQHLDEQVLVEEFSMSRIEARKLALFACGWQPNTGGRHLSEISGGQ